MKQEELKKIIMAAATKKEGKLRLSCAQAFALSTQINGSLEDIGRLCNELKIKIIQCQLGCF